MLNGITHLYGNRRALDAFSLSVLDSRVGLLGVNGAGKSTLMSVAAGIISPTEGTVTIDGLNMARSDEHHRALERVGLMPQHLTLPGHLTAHEAVSYLTWMRGARWRDAVRQAHEALEKVHLADRSRSKVHQLSGGMKRRVALAQALAHDPKVLLLDEPTTGVDPEQRREMLPLIANLDVTVLISSHIIEDIEASCSYVVVLHDGATRFEGSLDELATHAPEDTTSRVLEEAFMAVIGQSAP